MSSLRVFLIAIVLLFLFIPFDNVNAQLKITSSEGVKVIGDPEAFEKSGGETKGDTWTRTYTPGEQERENQQSLEGKMKEQPMAAEKKVKEENQSREKKLELRKAG